jgi:hypothetical protein
VKGSVLRSKLIRWFCYLGGWTLFALFLISEDAGRQLYQGRAVEWHAYLVVWLTTAYAWAFLAPFVWWLAGRFPIGRRAWWRSGAMHLAGSLCFALIEEALFAGITPVFGLPWFPRNFVATFLAVVPIDFHLNVIIYWLIVGAQHSVGYYRRFLERERASAQLELRATQLEGQLAQAKLSALKMQLHPHFLFNTLHAIVVLVRQHRVEEADEMLTNLSELLRQTPGGMGNARGSAAPRIGVNQSLSRHTAGQIPGPLDSGNESLASDAERSGPEPVTSAAGRECNPAWRL